MCKRDLRMYTVNDRNSYNSTIGAYYRIIEFEYDIIIIIVQVDKLFAERRALYYKSIPKSVIITN